MEKELKTIANIIENTNGQVVKLNDGCYLYLSNEVISSIVYSNDYIFNNIFNEEAKNANSIIESINKERDNMFKRIKELEDKLEYYKGYVKKFNNTINAKEATIAQYVRDNECLNERIESLEDHLRDHVKHTDILKNIVDSDKEAIDKYIRDFNCLNNHIKNVKNNINKYIELTDKIDNNFKNDIIEFINREFGYESINDAEPVNCVAYDGSECL